MKLLLINKNPVVSRMMMMSVPKAGFEIEECEDVYHLPSGHYDVVVIDDEMYDENFLNVIKQNLKYYQLGLVTSSTNINTSEFDFLLSKPFLPTDLIEILRKIKTDIESQKEQVPLFQEEEKEDSSPFDMFVEEESTPVKSKESIVQIEEEPEESPFVTEDLGKSGVLDEDDLQEVTQLLEEKEEAGVAKETPESILTESVEKNVEEKEEKIEEPLLIEPPLQEQLHKSLQDDHQDEHQESEASLQQPAQISNQTSAEALESITDSVQNLSIASLKELLDGMQLNITIKISFPDKDNV